MIAQTLGVDGGLLVVMAVVIGAATFIVHVMFAIAVFVDARRQIRSLSTIWFVPAEIWALATLLGGVFVAAVYWLMHCSTFARPSEDQGPMPDDLL